MTTSEMENYVSGPELAKQLEITPQAIRQRIRRGNYPHSTVIGRIWYIPLEEVEKREVRKYKTRSDKGRKRKSNRRRKNSSRENQ